MAGSCEPVVYGLLYAAMLQGGETLVYSVLYVDMVQGDEPVVYGAHDAAVLFRVVSHSVPSVLIRTDQGGAVGWPRLF